MEHNNFGDIEDPEVRMPFSIIDILGIILMNNYKYKEEKNIKVKTLQELSAKVYYNDTIINNRGFKPGEDYPRTLHDLILSNFNNDDLRDEIVYNKKNKREELKAESYKIEMHYIIPKILANENMLIHLAGIDNFYRNIQHYCYDCYKSMFRKRRGCYTFMSMRDWNTFGRFVHGYYKNTKHFNMNDVTYKGFFRNKLLYCMNCNVQLYTTSTAPHEHCKLYIDECGRTSVNRILFLDSDSE